MPGGAAEEVVLNNEAQPEVLDVALITLDLKQAAVQLRGKKRGD